MVLQIPVGMQLNNTIIQNNVAVKSFLNTKLSCDWTELKFRFGHLTV